MGVYDPARRHPVIVVAVCLIIIATAVFFMLHSSPPRRTVARPGDVFFDEDSGELAHGNPRDVPPVANAKGQLRLVRAVMPSETEPLLKENIVYLFRFSADAKARLEAALAEPNANPDALYREEISGKEVRLPAPNAPWVAADSEAGKNVMSR